MKKQIKRNRISANYYDNNFIEYENYYSTDHLHYGLWYNNTTDHEESLLNTVKEVVRLLNIQSNDIVLDAGCGTGGASRYLVNNCNVKTYGITMSEELLKVAKQNSLNCLNNDILDISIMDYTTTTFPNEFFSKVFAIESVCHAENKVNFIKEMHRVLSKNGVLVVAEYFKIKKRLSTEEKRNYGEFLAGWAIPYLSSVKDFIRNLKKYKFHDVEVFDYTNHIKVGSKLMYDYAWKRIAHLLSNKNYNSLEDTIKKHLIATAKQKYCIDKSLWGYFLIKAVKE